MLGRPESFPAADFAGDSSREPGLHREHSRRPTNRRADRYCHDGAGRGDVRPRPTARRTAAPIASITSTAFSWFLLSQYDHTTYMTLLNLLFTALIIAALVTGVLGAVFLALMVRPRRPMPSSEFTLHRVSAAARLASFARPRKSLPSLTPYDS